MKGKTAAVLAGGKSSRFGNDKALASFGKTSLLGYLVGSLKPVFNEVLVISGETRRYGLSGALVLPDVIKSSGPLGGIHTALSAADSDYVFITACDMPFISLSLIEKMRAEIRNSKPSAVVTNCNGFIEPFHAFYSTSLINEIEDSLAESSCGLFSFLKKISPAILNAEEEKVFVNINTPADLRKHSLII